ncbi:hypothetical protein [Sinomicrobium weinanense]|uniref:Lipoprotein n=1 Tax=Sinomicrobium weinanense TaxID=2842200 RepID=A0A926Q3T9_9FLAO|nr:hypothetical protein [Sinomicrobium weinanense]MBC9796361.1 hypothetical protein [Sinomicrobium weinanense]MBU3122437.1 hypothetical protein [Sinomicrobium weinanense]
MRIKPTHLLRLFMALFALAIYSCQNDTTELPDEVAEEQQTTEDLRSELTPLSTQDLPEKVKEQLELTRENLAKYLPDDLQIENVQVLGSVTTEKGMELSHRAVTNKGGVIAYGNITDPASVHIGFMQSIYSGKELSDTQSRISEAASQEIKTGDKVMEITWKNGTETYRTQCFYRNDGIVWDNILSGLVMIDTEGQTETSEETVSSKDNNTQARTYSKYYKSWWTAKWLWGSERGQMGYKITIYYSSGRVSNTDVSDWGYISLGKAKSYSRVVKNYGSYGKCQYALGMCTPFGSLSFSYSGFKVSFSGIGSNVVANGYKSLYP